MAKTIEQWIADLDKKIQQIEQYNKPLEIAVKTTAAMQAQRIFEQGKTSAGGQIGQYDTKTPFYINPDKAPRKTANKAKGIEGLKKQGKTGKTEFKNGKKHKTAYVNNYKDFRNRIGRRIDTVNINLSGDLQSDYSNAPIGKNVVNPKKVDVHNYKISLVRQINIDKKQGLEDKYGKIFDLTTGEKKLFYQTASFEINRILAK